MKDIGFTENGGRLVEMNGEEYQQFVLLSKCIEGIPAPFLGREDMQFREGFDFSKTFEVIRAFYVANFKINEIQNFVDAVKGSLGTKKK